MSRSMNIKIGKIVRQIATEIKWSSTIYSYSDIRATDRKLSFAYNGWRLPDKMKDEMIKRVTNLINQRDDLKQHVIEIKWNVAEKYGYGSYDKFVVLVNK